MQSFFFFLITAFPLFFIKDLSAHPVRWNVLICMQADDILKSPTDASLKALIHKIESFGNRCDYLFKLRRRAPALAILT